MPHPNSLRPSTGWSRTSGAPGKPDLGLLGRSPAVRLLKKSALAAEVKLSGYTNPGCPNWRNCLTHLRGGDFGECPCVSFLPQNLRILSYFVIQGDLTFLAGSRGLCLAMIAFAV